MCPNFLGQGVIRFDAVVGNNKCFDDFLADWVRFADGRGQQDGRMAHQAILDFAGTDTVSRTGDDIVVTAQEPNIAVLIGLANISGQKPIAKKFIGGGLRITLITEEHHRIGCPHGNAAGDTGW
jgi:hypothetical protein